MNNNIEIDYIFPEPLEKDAFLELLIKCKEGDMEARDSIIIHNSKLVLNQVLNKFASTPYDEEDLFSIGIIGLIKAIDTFDINKNANISTYATRCINNEILMSIRKGKKYLKDIKLEEPISLNGFDNIKVKDVIADDSADFTEKYDEYELWQEVRRQVENLEERDKEVIKLYFGFYNNVQYTQEEISNKVNTARSNVSRIISRVVEQIEKNLIKQDFIEKPKKSLKIKKYNK